MNISKRLGIALSIGIMVFLISIFIAYISFNILGSSAEAKIQNWKIGGAFAAFVLTALLLTSIILQFYERITSDKTETLREQVYELQNKLIRGATCPTGFVIDIDEKHKIVFARPSAWTPRNGILYYYVNKIENDKFNENFNVIYRNKEDLKPIYEFLGLDTNNVFSEDLYENIIKYEISSLNEIIGKIDSTLKEFIIIDGMKSLKTSISYLVKASDIRLCQSIIITYVPKLQAVYQFTFSDNEEDYQKTSEIFNTVIMSVRFL